ncbi:MAG: FAD:protein FMN transferase [Bacteroidetes bacterium]|nr:FAD:protein FMN transferase [Bacteroidota bacterium]
MKHAIFIFSISLLSVLFFSCNTFIPKPVKLGGSTQGTYYAITYYDKEGRNFQLAIDSILKDFDTVASMWVDSSIISKVNRNEITKVSNADFKNLYEKSFYIYEKSNGSFDPTVGPLVNAWGFGFTDRMKVDQHIVDSLMPVVGFNKVSFKDGILHKELMGIQFDFNAIAQGYSVDLLGNFFESKGIQNYLIDVGGEVLGKGRKPNGDEWQVGIEKPKDNAEYGESLEAIVKLEDKALATSGNYRKFYEEGGVRYSHTIDPKTGYPVQHSLLSVSVLADNCAFADGWATAFMVMGLDKSIEILGKDKSLDAYFIYSGTNNGELRTYFTEGFNEILVEDEE